MKKDLLVGNQATYREDKESELENQENNQDYEQVNDRFAHHHF
jgi:hypothetical protein